MFCHCISGAFFYCLHAGFVGQIYDETPQIPLYLEKPAAHPLKNPKKTSFSRYYEIHNTWREAASDVMNDTLTLERIDKPLVTIFGGHSLKKDSRYYKMAYSLAQKLAQAGCAVISGGGPGIMEAVNCGARTVKNRGITSIAIGIHGLGDFNSCAQAKMKLHYFFPRKWLLMNYSSAFIAMPGGIGTVDEFSQLVTLMDTKEMTTAPVYVVGTEYWKNFRRWFEHDALAAGLISQETVDLVTFTNDIDAIVVGIVASIKKELKKQNVTAPDNLRTQMIGG